MHRTSHNDRAARRKRLLDFLSKTLEDQVCQLEELVRNRVPLGRSGAAHASAGVLEIQTSTPEATFPKIPTPECEAMKAGFAVLREETACSTAPPIMTPTLAEIYASQGLISEAVSVLKQILKQDPEREEVRRRLDDLQRASSI